MERGEDEIRGSWALGESAEAGGPPTAEVSPPGPATETSRQRAVSGPGRTSPPRPRRGRLATAGIVTAALVAGAGGGAAGAYYLSGALSAQRSAASGAPRSTAPASDLSGGASPASPTGHFSPSAVASKISPGVVDINTVLGTTGAVYGQGAGTGMIISSSGEILTNNHVVEGASTIRVTVPVQGRTYNASVLGVDPAADVALLKISASGLRPVSIGNSTTAAVGQPVVAVGNALGLGGSPTVTSGIVSALGRSITAANPTGTSEHLSGLIQTDAPISPGNSGGPLANASGQVIGMNTAAAAGGGGQGGTNIGFAIPINTAMSVVHQILAGNTSGGVMLGRPGFLGVMTVPANSFLGGPAGAVVQGVVPGSPAASAGITPGDAIVGIDGKPVSSPSALRQAIDSFHPGATVQVSWVGPSGRQTQTVRLATGLAV